MATAAEKAELFRSLHHREEPLVLPNAWDVASARLFEEAGFPAVATSSAGLMVSRGYPDGEGMPRRELLEVVGRIQRALSVPLSADLVSGYGPGTRAVTSLVRQVLEAGAVGINLEDQDPASHGLFPLPSQVRKLRALRALGTKMGIPLVINARTDALRLAPGTTEERFREALRRCCAFRDAGADCVYPMGLTEAAAIEEFVRGVSFPVNVMVRPGLPSVPELRRLGVKRISFGPSASYAALGLLRRAAEEIRTRGTFTTLTEGALNFEELNRLAVPRPSSGTPG